MLDGREVHSYTIIPYLLIHDTILNQGGHLLDNIDLV